MNDASRKTACGDGQRLTVVVAWILVGIPLAWGVYETFQGAMKLFQ
ncbi:MAG TPA: oxalate:formate antiporter [Alphaproteobacteria bacterium]|jgi:hypothetical protein|nr:oxalate:formate antiporter [Alphaproteobacteria bacterium]